MPTPRDWRRLPLPKGLLIPKPPEPRPPPIPLPNELPNPPPPMPPLPKAELPERWAMATAGRRAKIAVMQIVRLRRIVGFL